MRIGMVGLGKMGGNMTARLLADGHEVVVHDLDEQLTREIGSAAGATPASSLEEILQTLQPPRVVWVMVPAGAPTETTLEQLAASMGDGDVLIDGGNTRYTDTIRRATHFAAGGIRLIDAGTSGGVHGRENGYCLMVGGERAPVSACEPIFRSLAMEGGYAHVGPAGAGHFTKMVHNGIEYRLL
jgi:6-phosphogluconate dehydrogenase